MKILIYLTAAGLNPHMGVLLDEAEKYIQEGHDVTVLSCDKTIGCCLSNPTQQAAICLSCKLQKKFLVHKLSKRVKIYDINQFHKGVVFPEFHYKSILDLKKIEYKGIDIGYAVVSTYVTLTRNLNPKFDESYYHLINEFLKSSVILTEALIQAIKEIKPDRICLSNGRLFETKPALRLGQQNNIETYVYEVTGISPNFRTVYFINTLPHDIQYNTQLINDFWNNSKQIIDEKIKIGEDFYKKKKLGIAVNDVSYTASQNIGQLPEGWDKTKMNIVIFNSSEDEFVAIGEEYEKKIFPSQIEGMEYILSENVDRNDIHFYIRIHPNLKKIQYKYHLDIYKFAEYSNCDIIPADSPVSTYSLIDNANKIIAFGSTTGIEACFWNKPVILLSTTFYSNLDVAYLPQDKEELQELIREPILKPKSIIGALKYGYYSSDMRGQKFQYFNYNFSNYKQISEYKTIFGSNKLYRYFFSVFHIVSKINRKFGLDKGIPLNEE